MSLNILGIETSCDETAAAIYNENHGVLANQLFSQIELHTKFGGVIPELASRSHLEKIRPIITSALEQANFKLNDIDVIAVTNKPGLPGSLLVGLCFAKAIAWTLNKKIIGVNHIEGHVFSACIEHNIPFPFICLTASGGHTALFLVEDFGKYTLIGQTIDDAAGEAFDKISKLIGLGYPGGPIIEKFSQAVNYQDFFNYPRSKTNNCDFSFSGLKTAVLYDLVKRNAFNLETKEFLKSQDTIFQQQVASSLLNAISDIFEQKILLAFKQYPEIKALSFVGGVAANKFITSRLDHLAKKHNKSFFKPSPAYCTDNAAMIAFVGNYKAKKEEWSDLTLDIY